MRSRVLGLIMAGGRGERLYPLTRDRAKPAVPFGGKYRIIDFVLSNFINSGIYSLYVLTQFKSQSLAQHIRQAYQFGKVLSDHFIITVPAQMQTGTDWYRGTADCVFQNLNLVQESAPDMVAVFGADHIYRMDIRQMVADHLESNAEITIATLPIPRAEARAFGVVKVDRDWRITGFQEKPHDPTPMPERRLILPDLDGQLPVQHRDPHGVDGNHGVPGIGFRLRPGHLPADHSRPPCLRLQLRQQHHPGVPRRRAELLLARRREHRHLLPDEHGAQERQSAPEPLQPPVADHHRRDRRRRR